MAQLNLSEINKLPSKFNDLTVAFVADMQSENAEQVENILDMFIKYSWDVIVLDTNEMREISNKIDFILMNVQLLFVHDSSGLIGGYILGKAPKNPIKMLYFGSGEVTHSNMEEAKLFHGSGVVVDDVALVLDYVQDNPQIGNAKRRVQSGVMALTRSRTGRND